MTDRILRLQAVIDTTGLSRATIYKLIGAGQFPRPRQLSTRSVGWSADAITAWLASRPSSRAGTKSGIPAT